MKRTPKGAIAPTVTPILKLVPEIPIRRASRATDKVYQDCVDQLRYMLRKAEQGELVGLAFAAMYSDGEQYFKTDVSGEASENYVFTAGMLASLSFQLMKKVNE